MAKSLNLEQPLGRKSKCLGNLVQFSFNNVLKIMPGFVDTMVGDAVLGEVVGSNFFCPKPPADDTSLFA